MKKPSKEIIENVTNAYAEAKKAEENYLSLSSLESKIFTKHINNYLKKHYGITRSQIRTTKIYGTKSASAIMHTAYFDANTYAEVQPI